MCYVYHYTTTDGFKGILESGEIWATSIHCLNDWTEFQYAREPFTDSVRALLKDKEAADGATLLLSDLFEKRPPLFVCSFSSAGDGDDLSQWRAYSHPYGCAIGFEMATLLNYAGMLKFDLSRCEYGTAGIQEMAKGTAEIMKKIIQMAGGMKSFRSQYPCGGPLKELIFKIVARYKNEGYSAEQEHRLLHYLQPGDREKYTPCPGKRRPYVALSLKNDKDWTKPFVEKLWKDARIVMSPRRPEKAQAEREVLAAFVESQLRKQHLPTDCAGTVRVSQVPYDPE
ncbi:MAG: hypothetical protein JW993_12960 [Sedimentisphaerales bacterium]|nr:hypothetical protein [Sedimentisphaerales bacterium]